MKHYPHGKAGYDIFKYPNVLQGENGADKFIHVTPLKDMTTVKKLEQDHRFYRFISQEMEDVRLDVISQLKHHSFQYFTRIGYDFVEDFKPTHYGFSYDYFLPVLKVLADVVTKETLLDEIKEQAREHKKSILDIAIDTKKLYEFKRQLANCYGYRYVIISQEEDILTVHIGDKVSRSTSIERFLSILIYDYSLPESKSAEEERVLSTIDNIENKVKRLLKGTDKNDKLANYFDIDPDTGLAIGYHVQSVSIGDVETRNYLTLDKLDNNIPLFMSASPFDWRSEWMDGVNNQIQIVLKIYFEPPKGWVIFEDIDSYDLLLSHMETKGYRMSKECESLHTKQGVDLFVLNSEGRDRRNKNEAFLLKAKRYVKKIELHTGHF